MATVMLCLPSSALLFLFATSVSAIEIYLSDSLHLCSLQFEQYSVVLNATKYASARAACNTFGMDLVQVDAPREPVLSTVGMVLLDCAALGGMQAVAGWVSAKDATGRPAGGSDANCMGVDFTGTLVSGSVSSCTDGELYPVCKRRAGDSIRGSLLRSVDHPSTSSSSLALDNPNPIPPYLPIPPIPAVPAVNCTLPADLPTCPLSVLGYKVIQLRLDYRKAECACKSLGMSLADPTFLSFWPAAFLTHSCGGWSSLAWMNSAGSDGCLAMNATRIKLNGPRIASQPCSRELPAVCMGPVLSNWNELGPLFAVIGMDGLSDALNSLYPLPRLPSLSDIARMTPLKSGNPCQSANYRIVKVEQAETAEEACKRQVNGRLAVVSSSNRMTLEQMVRNCRLVPEDGIKIAAPEGYACAFMDRAGTMYLAQSHLAKALYPPCLHPSAAVCRI